ncbi:MAG: hypothetical protein Q7R35_08705 [Elusimicrobiota bacterium]|nr:hypothetical protein [Elusimicrobiota bacterium]
MNNNNEKEEKKGGFLSALSGLFRGGSSVAGSASSGMGSAGMSSASGLAGLFATKAGIVGMVLGGATIATGVMVVSTFMGPSSKAVSSADLFQNSYLEEESSRAGLERAKSRDTSAAASSTLDMFRDQAKKDGLGGLASEAGEGGNADASAGAPGTPADSSADAAAAAPGADGASGGAAGAGAPRLQASSGFGGKGGGGGGSATSIPKMQSGGGLSGGIGSQFQSVYRPPANSGKMSGMTASAARVKSSPKFAVPNVNKKGAYGQAKYAGKMGAKAAYSADGAGSRTDATNAFSGETTGSGDVAAPGAGAGLGGAGVSNSGGLKGNDPSLNTNESTPPKVPTPEDVDPWQAEEDAAMKGMMWAFGMIIVTKLLSKLAKNAAGIPWLAAALYIAAMAAAAAAIYFAFKVIMAGYAMYSTYGQKMMGGIYMLTGVMLMLKAIEALGTAASGAGGAGATAATSGTTIGVNGATATVAGTPAVPGVLGAGASGVLNGIGSMTSGIGGITGGM